MEILETDNNSIKAKGSFLIDSAEEGFKFLIGSIHSKLYEKSYDNILLDFTNFQGMSDRWYLNLACQIQNFKLSGKQINFLPPTEDNGKSDKFLRNSGLGYYIAPDKYSKVQQPDPSYFRGNFPVISFKDYKEQSKIVEDIVLFYAKHITFKENLMQCIEWVVNELTGNILEHSNSEIGGFIMCHKNKRKDSITIHVADAGVGISESLKGSFPNLQNFEILAKSIERGITADPSKGQGNGLAGTFSLSQKTDGFISIFDKGASLFISSGRDNLKKSNNKPHMGAGVSVSTEIGLKRDVNIKSGVLEDEILKNISSNPTQFELNNLNEDGDNLRYFINDWDHGFGNRISGKALKTFLLNQYNQIKGSYNGRLIIDFEGVDKIISSSCADEAFGKLCQQIGSAEYQYRIKFENLSDENDDIIRHSVYQRMN